MRWNLRPTGIVEDELMRVLANALSHGSTGMRSAARLGAQQATETSSTDESLSD